MKLSYVKLHEEVRVNGRMVLELHDAAASAIGAVVESEGGAVLIPWHMIRWGVEATSGATVIAPKGPLEPEPARRKKGGA